MTIALALAAAGQKWEPDPFWDWPTTTVASQFHSVTTTNVVSCWAVSQDTFSAQPLSPRPLAVIKCKCEQHLQRNKTESPSRWLTAIINLAAMGGVLYSVIALIKKTLMADGESK